MTTATQQIPSNPALDFAQSILDVTNNGLELIEILRDIAQDNDEVASTNDRIAATNILNDRAFGKSPKQITPSAGPNPEPAPETKACLEPAEEGRGACPEPSRRVTQIDDTLNESLGPAPSASRHTTQTPEPFDPNSIHFTIQQHILAITNNGQMLRDILLEIARACPEPVEGAEDDPEASPEPRRRITPYHRRRAVILLLDRALGTDPALIRNGVCPDCRRKWTTHPGSPDHPEQSSVVAQVQDRPSDDEIWAKIDADLKQLEDEGILTPDPDAPPIDISMYRPPEDYVMPPEVAAEEAAKFWAEIDLRVERRKKWPEIEERRRKKLAQIYPSHSEDDGEQPET